MGAYDLDPRILAVGVRVRQLRQSQGLSQRELGERMEADRIAIARIERMEHLPMLPRIFQVADALGVPVAELFRPPRGTAPSIVERDEG